MDALLRLKASVSGENDIKRLGNSMQGVQGKVKNLRNSVGRLGGAFKALFAAAAIGGFASVIKGAIDSADSFQKLEVRTGIAAEKLMAYVEAGKLADVSQKQLEVGLKTLARTQVEAADGVKTYADTYAKLGIDVKNVNGDLKPTDQLLGEIADRFADLPDGPEKAAAALDLFGKSGVDMITMLNGGSAALEEFNFGLSGEFAQNAAFYNDEVTKLGREFRKFGLQLVDALLPALTQITQSFATLFDEGTNLEPLFKVIGFSLRTTAGVIFATIKLVDALIKTVVDGAKIIGRVFTGDFSGALDLARSGLGGFVEDAKKDFEELGNILTGTATAPEGYTRQRGGTGLERLPEKTTGKTDAEKEEDAYKKFTDQVLKFQIERENGAKQAIADIQEETKFAQLRLKQGEDFANAVQRVNELVQQGVPFSEAFQLVEARENVRKLQEAQDDANQKAEQQANTLKDLYKSIGDTIENNVVSAIEGLIDGTKSLAESLSGLLRQLGGMFLQFGMKSLFGSIFPSANGNVVANNKIVPFAYGGVINKPTLFPMANGAGLMGEAGPEAIMPLRRTASGRLGVESSGGVGNVVVNVDATGSSVQGDQPSAEQLGRAIGQAVQAELIKQKRPGGLLTR